MQSDFSLNACVAATHVAAYGSCRRPVLSGTGVFAMSPVFSIVKILKIIFSFQNIILNLGRVTPHNCGVTNEPYTDALRKDALIKLLIPYTKTKQTLILFLKS